MAVYEAGFDLYRDPGSPPKQGGSTLCQGEVGSDLWEEQFSQRDCREEYQPLSSQDNPKIQERIHITFGLYQDREPQIHPPISSLQSSISGEG